MKDEGVSLPCSRILAYFYACCLACPFLHFLKCSFLEEGGVHCPALLALARQSVERHRNYALEVKISVNSLYHTVGGTQTHLPDCFSHSSVWCHWYWRCLSAGNTDFGQEVEAGPYAALIVCVWWGPGLHVKTCCYFTLVSFLWTVLKCGNMSHRLAIFTCREFVSVRSCDETYTPLHPTSMEQERRRYPRWYFSFTPALQTQWLNLQWTRLWSAVRVWGQIRRRKKVRACQASCFLAMNESLLTGGM